MKAQKEVICTARTKAETISEAVEEVVKHKRPKRSEDMQVHTDPGDNTKYISNAMLMWNWEKPDMTSVEAVQKRIEDYFNLCAANDNKPSVAGMAFAFGIDRRTLWKWVNGIECQFISEPVRDTIKKAYRILNIVMEDYMQNGKINPVSGIFLMKNNMGYADQSEIVITPNSPLGSESNPESVTQKYAELPTE